MRNTISQNLRYPNFRLQPKQLTNKLQNILASHQWNRTITEQVRNKCLSQYPQHFSLSIQPRIKTEQTKQAVTFPIKKQHSPVLVPNQKYYESLFHKNSKMSFKKMSQIKQNLVQLRYDKTVQQNKLVKQKLFVNNSLVYSSLKKTKSDKKNCNDTYIKKFHFQTLQAKKNKNRYLIRKVNNAQANAEQHVNRFNLMKKSINFSTTSDYNEELRRKIKEFRYIKGSDTRLNNYRKSVQKKQQLTPWDQSEQEDVQMFPKPYAQQIRQFGYKGLINN